MTTSPFPMLLACSIALLTLGGCAKNNSTSEQPVCAKAAVRGEVTYRSRIALDQRAVVDVRLVDAAKMDVAAITLAEISISADERAGRQVPIPFTLVYDAAKVDKHSRLLIQARILVDDLPVWISGTSVPFDPATTTQPVEVVVQQVQVREQK